MIITKDKQEYKNMWDKLLKPFRFGESQSIFPDTRERSAFIQDYDRIIYSSSFRRLSKKTQVHPLTRNDHIHNRLTHSLEVSCVGRSLGNKLGFWLKEQGILPDGIEPQNLGEIVQAACVAHDIGNPPFGHAGEEAIRDWFNSSENNFYLMKGKLKEKELADFKTFDGNAQGFRIITSLEMYKDNGGMRLTFPTLASIVKYPYCALDGLKQNKCKFNFYTAEEKIFDRIFNELGLKICRQYIRHPLSYFTEAADDICYRIIDMEDARELNIINLNDIMEVIIPIKDNLELKQSNLLQGIPDRRKSGYIRGVLIGYMVNAVFNTFLNNFQKIMEEDIAPLIDLSDENTKKYMENAKSIFYNTIMKNPTKTALEIGSYSVYKRLLDNFIPAAHNKILDLPLSFRQNRALDLMGINAPKSNDGLYLSYLRVIDFISGMTDDYATFVSKQLAGI